METLELTTQWELKSGSHRFPRIGGGTCINEAAVIAAGFPYRRVCKPEDMPECFSRPICRLAMSLNDRVSRTDRQRLLPFVLRLACADSPEVENERAIYIATRTRRRLTIEEGIQALEGALAIGGQADLFLLA